MVHLWGGAIKMRILHSYSKGSEIRGVLMVYKHEQWLILDTYNYHVKIIPVNNIENIENEIIWSVNQLFINKHLLWGISILGNRKSYNNILIINISILGNRESDNYILIIIVEGRSGKEKHKKAYPHALLTKTDIVNFIFLLLK